MTDPRNLEGGRPVIDRNHPAVEAAAQAALADGWTCDTHEPRPWGDCDDCTNSHLRSAPRALRAALPHLAAADIRHTPAGRELMAQTLRAAARAAVSVEEGVPWVENTDREIVAVWLDDLAESIHPGSPDAAKEGDQ